MKYFKLNFWTGFCRVFNFRSNTTLKSNKYIQSDEDAIKSDWEAVGNDLFNALGYKSGK